MDEKRTVLLDTQIWRYLLDAGQLKGLKAVAQQHRLPVTVSPAVLYEILRFGNVELTKQMVEAMTRQTWRRLMPEVFRQAEDLTNVLRVRRPEWLRTGPDLEAFRAEQADWTGRRDGVWSRCRADPLAMAQIVRSLEGDAFAKAKISTDELRAELSDEHLSKLDLYARTRVYDSGVPGWEGTPVAEWRADAAVLWWDATARQRQQAFVDWTAPFLDIAAIHASEESWNHLWLHEVTAEELPREWLRWAFRLLQATRAQKGGLAGDNHIATHLLEVDALVTADKTLAAISEVARSRSPFPLAPCHRVAGGAGDPLEALRSAFDKISRR